MERKWKNLCIHDKGRTSRVNRHEFYAKSSCQSRVRTVCVHESFIALPLARGISLRVQTTIRLRVLVTAFGKMRGLWPRGIFIIDNMILIREVLGIEGASEGMGEAVTSCQFRLGDVRDGALVVT